MYSTQCRRAFQYSEHLLPFSRITVSVLRGRLSRLWKNSQVHHGSNLEAKNPSLLSDRLFKLIFFSPYPCNSASLMEIMTFLLAARQSERLIMRQGWMFHLTQPLSAISQTHLCCPDTGVICPGGWEGHPFRSSLCWCSLSVGWLPFSAHK